MDMIKGLAGKFNPQQLVLDIIGQDMNPMFKNLIEMAQKGDEKGLENFARNICKEQGRDFDKEFQNFMKNFK